MMVSLVASIPSPSSNSISVGPIDLRAYGILIAIGVLAGVWLASRRLAQDGLDPETIPNLALWSLPAAIIGARIYFVATNWGRFSDDPASAFRLWEGGLGIPGGVALGMAVGVWWLRRESVPLPPVFTAVAVGLPLGQIIGRFGNWFNQELYGRPTDLPWGLEIDEAHRLPGYEANELFHPTFAYEILWNVLLLGALLWIDRKRVLRPGALFAVYLIGYGIGRILIELVRIDPVNELLGIRLHIWAMIAFIAGAIVYLYRYGWAIDTTLAIEGKATDADTDTDTDSDAADDADAADADADADADAADADADAADADADADTDAADADDDAAAADDEAGKTEVGTTEVDTEEVLVDDSDDGSEGEESGEDAADDEPAADADSEDADAEHGDPDEPGEDDDEGTRVRAGAGGDDGDED